MQEVYLIFQGVIKIILKLLTGRTLQKVPCIMEYLLICLFISSIVAHLLLSKYTNGIPSINVSLSVSRIDRTVIPEARNSACTYEFYLFFIPASV